MTKTARRALAAATISALAAGTLAAGPVASAGSGKSGRTLTNYGMKGTAIGAQLYVNNVKFLTASDAVAPLRSPGWPDGPSRTNRP